MKHFKIPKIIIIIGPPGSGKGTQAQLLSEKFGFFQFETSAIIGRVIEQSSRGEFVVIDGEKYFFDKQEKIRHQGRLWDSTFVFYFVKKKIEELAREKEGIVISGSPRNLDEGKKLTPLLEKLYGRDNIKVIALRLNPKDTLWRNSHRRECELATHSILYSNETKKLTKCPLDGSELIHRKDDNPEIIKTRLEEYKQRTFPLMKYFKKQGIKIKEIDGHQSVSDVFNDILKNITKPR